MFRRLGMGALVAAAAAPALAQDAPNPSFYFVNRAATAVTRVYASPAGMPNWGTDRLPTGQVRPGQNVAIRLPADGNCIYDLRVIYANGSSDERRGINTCDVDNVSFPQAGSAAGAAAGSRGNSGAARPGANPSFLLVNRSRAVLNELYLSPSGDDSWGEDRLGDGTLAAGASKTIRLPPGECQYDIRVVFANGEANERRRVNLCDITDLRVP